MKYIFLVDCPLYKSVRAKYNLSKRGNIESLVHFKWLLTYDGSGGESCIRHFSNLAAFLDEANVLRSEYMSHPQRN